MFGRLLCLWFALPAIVNPVISLAQAPTTSAPTAEWAGVWQGTLKVGVDLRLVFKIKKAGEVSYTATLDSLDQGAMDIPVTAVEIKEDAIVLTAAVIGGVYEGKRDADFMQIKGIWKQSGATFPLDLSRNEKIPELRRPQNPIPPFPYDAYEITFDNKGAGITLAGTLTVPHEGRLCPAVVLISGSGPQDRDESLLGHKPFLVLADHLTRKGIAVLRFDDRGVGSSTGSMETATSEDFAGDAQSGVEYLKSRPQIDPHRIGLVGHSEGGMIAPMVAVRTSDVKFIVLMAGTGVTGEEILYEQGALISRAQGASDERVRQELESQRKIFAAIRAQKDPVALDAQVRQIIRAEVEKLTEAERTSLGDIELFVAGQTQAVLSPWFKYFLTFDPAPTLAKVKCPVLAINGEKDLQVPPNQNLPMIEKALKSGGNGDVTVVEFPGLNHLFQTCTSGAPAEYSQIEETMAPEALETISDWIISLTNPAGR